LVCSFVGVGCDAFLYGLARVFAWNGGASDIKLLDIRVFFSLCLLQS
jgi:hypothetical protein